MIEDKKDDLKLIDVKTDFNFNGVCGVCGRKLKNIYVLNNGFNVGSECIFKLLKDNLENQDDLINLNYKLKLFKFMLVNCETLLINPEAYKENTFLCWFYDNNYKEEYNFVDFKYRFAFKELSQFMPYLEKNKNLKIKEEHYTKNNDLILKEIDLNKLKEVLKNE